MQVVIKDIAKISTQKAYITTGTNKDSGLRMNFVTHVDPVVYDTGKGIIEWEQGIYNVKKLFLTELIKSLQDVWIYRCNFHKSLQDNHALKWFQNINPRELPDVSEMDKWLDEEEKGSELATEFHTHLKSWVTEFNRVGSSYAKDHVAPSLVISFKNAVIRLVKRIRFYWYVERTVDQLPPMPPWDFKKFNNCLEEIFASRIHEMIRICYAKSEQFQNEKLEDISKEIDSPSALRKKFLVHFHPDKIRDNVAFDNLETVTELVTDIQKLSKYWEAIKVKSS